MTLKIKKDGVWKEASSLKVKINGEWKDVSTLYSKKDGAWVTVYSSGALIIFTNYPYPIPVAAGWKYSTDKVNWTTVETDGELNTDGGMFTGFVKANSITLNEYVTEDIPEQIGIRVNGTSLRNMRTSFSVFVNGENGYVCGGSYSSGSRKDVDVYDIYGSRTSGTSLSEARHSHTSFVNKEKGYVCGGVYSKYSTTNYLSSVEVYDVSGARTTGTALGLACSGQMSFVIGGKGYVCGGINDNGRISTVNIYDSSGNRTTGDSLSQSRHGGSTFTIKNMGFVCGGEGGNPVNNVDVFYSSGSRTSTTLSAAKTGLATFTNNNLGHVCGGVYGVTYYNVVEIFNTSIVRSTGTPLSVGRSMSASFLNNARGFVCGGLESASPSLSFSTIVDVYDISENRTTCDELRVARGSGGSFVNGGRGYVCGGQTDSSSTSVVDVYYDQPKVLYTKIPITEGSTYTLNGESGVADVSKVMEFDSKVTGTIKYKAGDMTSSLKLLVVSSSGSVISGAEVSFDRSSLSGVSSDWNMDNLVVTQTYVATSTKNRYDLQVAISGISGSTPPVSHVLIENGQLTNIDRATYRQFDSNSGDPNITATMGLTTFHGYNSMVGMLTSITLLDADGNVLAHKSVKCS